MVKTKSFGLLSGVSERDASFSRIESEDYKPESTNDALYARMHARLTSRLNIERLEKVIVDDGFYNA